VQKHDSIVIIDGRVYDASEVFNAIRNSTYTSVKIVEENLVLGKYVIKPLKIPVEEAASAITCYQSLAYCCPSSKPCARRDAALRLLKITVEEYEKLKNELHNNFLRISREKNGGDVRANESNFGFKKDENIPPAPSLNSLFQDEEKIIYERNFGKKTPPVDIVFNENRYTYCSLCGAKVEKDAVYCPMCGKKLKNHLGL